MQRNLDHIKDGFYDLDYIIILNHFLDGNIKKKLSRWKKLRLIWFNR